MTTNRTPLRRPGLPQVSARAIELFEQLERARRARRRSTDCTLSGPQDYCSGRCRACQQWWDLHDELHRELKLRPWQWPCVPSNPHPPGTKRSRDWDCAAGEGDEQQALWDLLDSARRSARAA
jgi:hypothetical protein